MTNNQGIENMIIPYCKLFNKGNTVQTIIDMFLIKK